jgi:hypothetical protein
MSHARNNAETRQHQHYKGDGHLDASNDHLSSTRLSPRRVQTTKMTMAVNERPRSDEQGRRRNNRGGRGSRPGTSFFIKFLLFLYSVATSYGARDASRAPGVSSFFLVSLVATSPPHYHPTTTNGVRDTSRALNVCYLFVSFFMVLAINYNIFMCSSNLNNLNLIQKTTTTCHEATTTLRNAGHDDGHPPNRGCIFLVWHRGSNGGINRCSGLWYVFLFCFLSFFLYMPY